MQLFMRRLITTGHLETVENFLERRGRAAGMLAKEAEALGLKLLLGAEIHIEQGISGLEKVDALVYEKYPLGSSGISLERI